MDNSNESIKYFLFLTKKSFKPTYCKRHLRDVNMEMFENCERLEKKLKKEKDNISYMIQEPTIKPFHEYNNSQSQSQSQKSAKRDYATLNKENNPSVQKTKIDEEKPRKKLVKESSRKFEVLIKTFSPYKANNL